MLPTLLQSRGIQGEAVIGKTQEVALPPEHNEFQKVADMEAEANSMTYIAIAMVMVGAMMFGLDQGNFGQVQNFSDFLEDWCIGGGYGDEVTCSHDSELGAIKNSIWLEQFVSWFGTTIALGAVFGALALGPVLSSRFGRRLCISAGAIICFLGCLFASYLSMRSKTVFFIARFFTGFGVGVCTYALPVYNAEVATAKIRGRTGACFQLFVVLGVFIATLFTMFVHDWKVGVMLPGIAAAFVAVAVWFIPESPRYVMATKGLEAGTNALKKVRRGDVAAEARLMWEAIESEKEVPKLSIAGLCNDSSIRWRTFLACTIMWLQQMTGINVFIGYSSTIFQSIGMENPLLTATLFNGIQVFGILLGIYLVDSDLRLGGRRNMLILAALMMAVPMLIETLNLAMNLSGVIGLVCVLVYGFGFQAAWGPVPWLYAAEIFSNSERDAANGLAVGVEYAGNVAMIYITPFFIDLGMVPSMAFFTVVNFLIAAFCFRYVTETRGVPVELVPALFGGAARDKFESAHVPA